MAMNHINYKLKIKQMAKRRRFKIKSVGWDLGCKFKIIDAIDFKGEWVYKLHFFAEKPDKPWIEFQSHDRLKKEKCLQYDDSGEHVGKHREKECLE